MNIGITRKQLTIIQLIIYLIQLFQSNFNYLLNTVISIKFNYLLNTVISIKFYVIHLSFYFFTSKIKFIF